MMKHELHGSQVDDGVVRRITPLLRRKAKRIVSQTHLRRVDVSDVENELWVALLELDAEFPRKLLSPCATKRAIGDAASTVICKLNADRKWRRRNARSIPDLQQRREQGAFDLAHDVAIIVANLPWRMGRLARRLMESSSSEVAARLQVSSSTVYAMIARIRKRFVMAGMVEKRAASLPRKSNNHH